jgi:CubicO group peptidase (beta-lactamase class C family)
MRDTSFYLHKDQLDRFPVCYRPEFVNQEWCITVFDRPETSEKVKGPKVHFAAGGDMGGVLSTAADYARFAQMLLNGGELNGVRILGRKSVELMTGSHTGNIVIPMLGAGFGFGLGVGVSLAAVRQLCVRWAPSDGVERRYYFLRRPHEKLLALCFTVSNMMMMPKYAHEEFERLTYQALV